jgi:hypothetical protein
LRRWLKEKGAGANPAPLRSGLIVLLRFAKNEAAACDQEQVELQGQTLAVLVFPRRADAVPELLFPALRRSVPAVYGPTVEDRHAKMLCSK